MLGLAIEASIVAMALRLGGRHVFHDGSLLSMALGLSAHDQCLIALFGFFFGLLLEVKLGDGVATLHRTKTFRFWQRRAPWP